MPNWTENELVLEGNAEHVQQIVSEICATEPNADGKIEAIDFNRIKPMPEILRNVVSPPRSDGKIYIDESGRDADGNYQMVHREATPEEVAEIQATGSRDWYDWACSNWGTKWNACHVREPDSYNYEQGKGKSWRLVFDTAWGPPEYVVSALRDKYENLEVDISLNYRNEDDPEYPHSL